MTEAVFQAPKRRPKIYESFDAPLPVPLLNEDASSFQETLVYKAEIINQHVIVRDTDHILALYGKGYFGKGILSRSRPEHSVSDTWERIGDKYLPVISFSKYQRHVNWARQVLLAQGLDEATVSQALQKLADPIQIDAGSIREEEQELHQGSPSAHRNPGPSQASPSADPSHDECMDTACGAGGRVESSPCEVEAPRRQGNLLYDPLAALYPREPERVDETNLAKVKCRRHDDWIVHCGCRPDEAQMHSVLSSPPGALQSDPSRGQDYVLVEEDDSGDPAHDNCTSRAGTRVCRISPFTMVEFLQLSLEEAFFLMYALGCLSIYYSGEPLHISEVWQMFCSVQPHFETTYAAYHYFRSKGWVPKTGIKYGTELLLYRKGPPFYHASYSVAVERVDESFRGSTLRPFTWRSLATLNRITGNVSKELMLCYIIVPSDLRQEALSSPEYLRKVRVQELIVSRWISSRERNEQDEI